MKSVLLSWAHAETALPPPASSVAAARTCPQTRFMGILLASRSSRRRALSPRKRNPLAPAAPKSGLNGAGGRRWRKDGCVEVAHLDLLDVCRAGRGHDRELDLRARALLVAAGEAPAGGEVLGRGL